METTGCILDKDSVVFSRPSGENAKIVFYTMLQPFVPYPFQFINYNHPPTGYYITHTTEKFY
jgi:hypothetical protein